MAENRVINSAVKPGCRVMVVGGSTGSLDVLLPILMTLQPPLTLALVIVLHRKNTANTTLANLLAIKTNLPVQEVDDKDELTPGYIYLAPADYHLLVEHNGTFSLDDSEKVHYSRPAIDVTFESVADVYGSAAVGILLSGANADGSQGLKAIQRAGGITVAQDPATAQVGYMPQQAINNKAADWVFDIPQLAQFIDQLSKANLTGM